MKTDLGKRIKILCLMKDMSIRDLADATDISVTSLYRWLNGVQELSFTRVIKVADVLEISLDELAGRIDG